MLAKDDSEGTVSENSVTDDWDGRARLAALLIWLGAVATVLLSILQVLGTGYVPGDDALRYAARAVSGRTWDHVLVLRPDAPLDHNPGWNQLLSFAHRVFHWDQDGLVSASVLGLFLLFCVPPLFLFRRAEAWVMSLAFSGIAMNALERLAFGRPYLITMSLGIILLILWGRTEQRNWRLCALTTLGFAIASYYHGSWYQSALLVGAFFLSGRIARALELGGCWLVGSFVGALFTGNPFRFLADGLWIAFTATGTAPLARMKVTEFQPSGGYFGVVMMVVVLILLRRAFGLKTKPVLKDPAFLLGCIGWLLGMKIVRFWVDWGLLGFLVWMTYQLQDLLDVLLNNSVRRRLAIAGFACLFFFASFTADVSGRWTNVMSVEYVDAKNPDLAEWVPEPGGILYTVDMALFYRTFFKNPDAPWRYILGFECTFMPKEDLEVYWKILWNYGAHKAYAPWVAKMRPEDRLFIRGNSGARPQISELEWYYGATDTWIGRVPRGVVRAAPGGSSPSSQPAMK